MSAAMLNSGNLPLANRVPVWAPDPGVPLIARLLAYIFGVLMLFTVMSSLRPRPPDIPAYPSEWRIFEKYGLTIPYPDNWQYQNRTQGENVHIAFYLPPRTDMVRVEIFSFNINNSTATALDPLGKSSNELASERFEEWLREEYYTGYTAKMETGVAGYHYFTAQPLSKDGPPIVGAWVSRVQGGTIIFATAASSAPAWHVTENIFSKIVENIQLATRG